MGGEREWHSRRVLALLTLMSLALAGCTASLPPPLPFQAMNFGSDISYGYKETKIDPAHYTVIYAGDREQLAQAYLERRAAQISRDAGFAYFAFDKRGIEVLKRSENDLVMRPNIRTIRDQGAASVNDYIPETHQGKVTTYYYAWGQVALLSAAQAQGNAGALQVSAVLARPDAGSQAP